MGRKKKWIQDAIRKPGAFTRYCKRRGYKGVTQECIEEVKKSKNPKTRQRAHLAETLRDLPKPKKRRKSK